MFFLNFTKKVFLFIYSYRGFFLKILYYEIYYSIKFKNFILKKQKGIKGLIKPIPTPYYFLKIIKSFLIEYNINSIVDIGSGTGRALNFFSDINDLKITGIEVSDDLIKISKKLTSNKINYINGLYQNITIDAYECYFMCDTLYESDFDSFLNYLKKISAKQKKPIYFIYINGRFIKKILENKKFKIISCIYNNQNNKTDIKGIGIFKL